MTKEWTLIMLLNSLFLIRLEKCSGAFLCQHARRTVIAPLVVQGSRTLPTTGSRTRMIRRAVAASADQLETKCSTEHSLVSPHAANSTSSWLVVGDGDLSFSAMLARKFSGSPTNNGQQPIELIASVLEDQETHKSVYRNSKHNTDTIQSCNQTVQFGLDATELHLIFQQRFDRIVFNFPHWRGKSNNRYNRQLIDSFLQSASQVLKNPDGEIHIALIHGQGGMEAQTMEEWRNSWTVPLFANQHGLLLRRIEPFDASYNRSSHRGVDRPFMVGDQPLNYVFGFPDGQATEERFQIACRHELRLILDPERLEHAPYTVTQLYDIVPKLLETVVPPHSIKIQVPLRDIIMPGKLIHPLLIFLVVYRGHSGPLTRDMANSFRENIEQLASEELQLDIAKRGRMVSKPFPYSIMSSLLENQSTETQV